MKGKNNLGKRMAALAVSVAMIVTSAVAFHPSKDVFASAEAETKNTKAIPENQEVGSKLVLDESVTYIIHNAYDQQMNPIANNNRALFDNGGANVGWLKYDDGFAGNIYAEKYRWQVTAVQSQEGQYYLRNLGTGFAVKDLQQEATNSSHKFVVSDKNKANSGDPYTFEIQEVKDGKYYVTLEAVSTGRIVAPENGAGDRTYAVFADDKTNKNNYWCIEEAPQIPEAPGQEGKILLWDSPDGNNYYRIPAIATANNGDLVAATDYRYGNANDLGGHQIDLFVKSSKNNGKTWSETTNLTDGYSAAGSKAIGYGDAALVADRESDNVLLLCASGNQGFMASNKAAEASVMTSKDNGATWSAPVKMSDQIYNLNSSFQSFFFASGRIMQSRYIKVKDHYRIYSAILAHPGNFSEKANWVLYSDDFGKTWNVLGSVETSCVPAGDEAKVEELPDGSVLISSRKGGGRYFNVFHYDKTDATYTRGSWDNVSSITIGNGRETNGEIMVVYAKEKATGQYKYLALQSFPAVWNRTSVTIYYKELDPTKNSAAELAQGWSADNSFLVQRGESAYSTMTLQKDGKIAFFWEESSDSYDMAFNSYTLERITDGKYEMAFEGIGSVKAPYLVETPEQKAAVAGIFKNEKVNWKFKDIAVTGVALNKNTTELKVGETENLTATITPEDATNKNVTWTSDKPEVATVKDGVVTAVAKGTAVITVTTVDGNKTATCTVTVKEDVTVDPEVKPEIDSVKVENGTITITLKEKPSKAPALEDMKLQLKLNGKEDTNLEILEYIYDADKTITLYFDRIPQEKAEQKFTITVTMDGKSVESNEVTIPAKGGQNPNPNPDEGNNNNNNNNNNSNHDNTTDGVKTGDSAPVLPFVILAIAALGAFGVVIFIRKRKEQN